MMSPFMKSLYYKVLFIHYYNMLRTIAHLPPDCFGKKSNRKRTNTLFQAYVGFPQWSVHCVAEGGGLARILDSKYFILSTIFCCLITYMKLKRYLV